MAYRFHIGTDNSIYDQSDPVYGLFAPQTFRPMDTSPHGRFAPWVFRPMDVLPHRRFTPKMIHPTDDVNINNQQRPGSYTSASRGFVKH